MTSPTGPSRRRVLMGLGVLAVAPAAASLTTPAAAAVPGIPAADPGVDARGYEAVAQPSCLADLIESGVVSRADLVAR